jgi:hypothetical protein
MKNKFFDFTLFCGIIFLAHFSAYSQPDANTTKYIGIIRKNIAADYKGMYRQPKESLKYPFLVPGSKQYGMDLWDWDSWLSNIALRQILLENGSADDKKEALKYEQGCVLNFLSYGGYDGWIPICLWPTSGPRDKCIPANPFKENMHKPCLAQHAAFITQMNNGDAEWLRDGFYFMQTFLNNYRMHHRSIETGLYFWQDDGAIGVDNDPCTFSRPKQSSGSIYLNCLMYKELLAMVYLSKQLNYPDLSTQFNTYADELKAAIQKNCWDEKGGFFYSVDLNLMPVKREPDEPGGTFVLHSGYPRDYYCLIQRIDVWSGFMAMWAGIATPEQAKRMVAENFKNPKTFNSPYGIRTLSKLEKQYSVIATGNPSNWRGPIWGISNYMVFCGLVDYGFTEEAKEMATKTVLLFGRDFEKYGALHEYYDPESGEPMLNKGFQNWNYLVMNMSAWLEGKPVIKEF